MVPLKSSVSLPPFLIEPRFVGKVWGYDDLRPWYNQVADKEPIGEVWLTGDDCRIATGAHVGRSLGELFIAEPDLLLGSVAPHAESPLLVKVIFAREKLSVQVHPDDHMAQKYGQPRGKTECWYALAAEPGAKVAAGLKPGVTLEQVRAGIDNGTLEESLNTIPVFQGDMIFVDAGTVHALWPGSILMETQQYSDTTYRMYDYGRPREMHIEKSLEATHLTTRAGKIPPKDLGDRRILIDVEYFRVERIAISGSRTSATLPGEGEAANCLSYLFVASGSARINSNNFESFEIPARGIACVPAASPAFTVEDQGGLELIRISPRWPVSLT